LIVEGYSAIGERVEDISYVNFWAACHTYMEMQDVKVDELLHKLENLVTRWWDPRDVGTFIKGIHY
jgi:hypothetical protein